MHLHPEQTMTGMAPRRERLAAVPTYTAFRATSYFAGLDVLRAIAILAVIWHHTAASAFDFPLSRKGYHGVTLFFAISGFLIVTGCVHGLTKASVRRSASGGSWGMRQPSP